MGDGAKEHLIERLREMNNRRARAEERGEYWYNYAMMILRQLDQTQKACKRHKATIKKLRAKGND